MSILTDILGIGAAAASGGLFGLVGSGVGQLFKYLEVKQHNAFKLKEWDHELELQKLMTANRVAETESEIRLTNEQGAWSGLNSSVQASAVEAASYLWVNAVKSLTRPVLTVALTVFLAITMILIGPGPERQELISCLTFAAVTAITWWFGDRAPHLARPKLVAGTSNTPATK